MDRLRLGEREMGRIEGRPGCEIPAMRKGGFLCLSAFWFRWMGRCVRSKLRAAPTRQEVIYRVQ